MKNRQCLETSEDPEGGHGVPTGAAPSPLPITPGTYHPLHVTGSTAELLVRLWSRVHQAPFGFNMRPNWPVRVINGVTSGVMSGVISGVISGVLTKPSFLTVKESQISKFCQNWE